MTDHTCFNFIDEDYELTEKDREYLKSEPNLEGLTEKEFERIIDALEKIAFMYKETQPTQVAKLFVKHADESILRTLKKPVME